MFRKLKQKVIAYIKKYGWKAAVAIFFYYLIRDVTLYILLPWLIAKNIMH